MSSSQVAQTAIHAPPPNIPATLLVSSGITISVSIFAAKWMFERLVAGFDQRFAAIETSQKELSRMVADCLPREDWVRQISSLEGKLDNLGELRHKVAQEYVRREDWIRFSSTIDAKMDGISRRMDEQMSRLYEKLGGK
jgi:hypothetical protein